MLVAKTRDNKTHQTTVFFSPKVGLFISFQIQISSSEYKITIHLAPGVRRVDNAIHRINRYSVDKCWQNKPRYPVDSDLSGG